MSKDGVHDIMAELGYELQDFSNDEIKSYFSPLKVFDKEELLNGWLEEIERKGKREMIEDAASVERWRTFSRRPNS